MSRMELQVHHTITLRIMDADGGGWEFLCEQCNYHARYTSRDGNGQQEFEILDIGNPAARHTSTTGETGFMGERLEEERFGDERLEDKRLEGEEFSEFDEENWLTPELRSQIEQIVKGFDLEDPFTQG